MKKFMKLLMMTLIILLLAFPAKAERELTTNEATIILIPLIVDVGDAATPEITLDVTAITVELIQEKDDGSVPARTAFAPTASGGGNDMVLVVDSTHGNYGLEIAAAQINYTGYLTVTVIDTDVFIPVMRHFKIVAANVIDSGYGTDNLEVDAVLVDSNDVTADNLHEFFGKTSSVGGYENFEDTFDSTGYAGGTIEWTVDAIEIDGNDVTADNLHEFFGKTSSVGAYEEFENMYDSTGYAGGTIKIETDVQEVDGVAAAATTMETFFDVSTAADNMHDFFSNATAYGLFDDMFDGTTISIASCWSDALAASDITDDWETQSQADPTGFEVNLKEINDTVTQLEMLMDATTSINADADLTTIVADKSVLSHLMTVAADTSVYNATEDSLEAQGAHLDTISLAAIADAVFDEDIKSSHQTVGTAGYYLRRARGRY